MQTADLRVATIAYRLAAAGEAICPVKAPLTGLTLHGASQYAPSLREAARIGLGAADGVALLAVVPESPGAVAGLQAGDEIVAIDGAALAMPASANKASFAAIAVAYARMEAAAAKPRFAMTVRRDASIIEASIAPVTGCASRVQLVTDPRIEARANGAILSLTTGLLDYVAGEDELALVIAHELAHNALGHRALLDTQGVKRGIFGGYGRNAGKVLDTERAADRLGYYLMARAGFDPGAAPGFWKRLYSGPAGAFSRPGTHPAGLARIAEARAITAEIADKRAVKAPLSP